MLIGDAINNFKTVQSFGYENLVIDEYVSLIEPILKAGRIKHVKSGIAFGFSQFVVYFVNGLLFYVGGWVADQGCETLANG